MEMNEMFNKQIELQEKLGNADFEHNQEFITIMTLAAIDELMEALRETPWKPWKKNQELHVEKFQEELIDVWHFLINLSMASGMSSEDVHRKFMEKNKINHKRNDEGY